MKKTYMAPALVQQLPLTENIIALSTFKGDADGSAVLVKDNDWDIWEGEEVEE